MDISVVVPVYGCRAALEELHQRLTATLSSLVSEYEIILVNDNCPQNSWEVIEQLCAKDQHVVGVELSRNFGQIRAITAGLDISRGDWVVVMDCDLQDRPEEIVNFYNKVQEGYDAVFARRAMRKDSGLKVAISNAFYKIYSWASDTKYDPAVCNFSMIKRNVVNAYCSMREMHRAYVMYINWLGFKTTTIDVDHNERFEGQSSYTMKKRIKLAAEIITSQSDKLLKFTAALGMIIAVLSFIALIVIVIQHLIEGSSVIGWTSTIAASMLIGGVTIMCVGLVGVYVGNIFMQSKERPLYVVRTQLNGDESDK